MESQKETGFDKTIERKINRIVQKTLWLRYTVFDGTQPPFMPFPRFPKFPKFPE
jgi:hypothetical protein